MTLIIESGSRTIMQMTTPPTGWTKDTSFNDYALRVTTGSVSNRTTGHSFSTVFKNYTNLVCTGTVTFSIAGRSITAAQMPEHIHFAQEALQGLRRLSPSLTTPVAGLATDAAPTTYGPAGASAPHSHPTGTVAIQPGSFINVSGTPSSINLALKYADVIIAVRD